MDVPEKTACSMFVCGLCGLIKFSKTEVLCKFMTAGLPNVVTGGAQVLHPSAKALTRPSFVTVALDRSAFARSDFTQNPTGTVTRSCTWLRTASSPARCFCGRWVVMGCWSYAVLADCRMSRTHPCSSSQPGGFGTRTVETPPALRNILRRCAC